MKKAIITILVIPLIPIGLVYLYRFYEFLGTLIGIENGQYDTSLGIFATFGCLMTIISIAWIIYKEVNVRPRYD